MSLVSHQTPIFSEKIGDDTTQPWHGRQVLSRQVAMADSLTLGILVALLLVAMMRNTCSAAP